MALNSEFEAHFLNVDHGDCTILRHPPVDGQRKGRISFVDIHDWKYREEAEIPGLLENIKNAFSSDSRISKEEYARDHLNNPIEYFKDYVAKKGEEVHRFISTHPDMDHLSGIKRLEEEIGFSVMWDSFHNRTRSEDERWKPRFDPEDWWKYVAIRDGETECKNIHPTRGTSEDPWKSDNIEILHPSPQYVMKLNERNEELADPFYNNMSYVLKVNTSAGAILLPGDIEKDAWDDVLDYCGDSLADVRILKASHHGRKSGFHQEAIEIMDPEYVIASVGKKTDTDAYSDYRRVCSPETEILSTRQYGAITVSVTEDGVLNVTKEVPDGIFSPSGNLPHSPSA